ncbi:anti-sigma factor antagonist [Streptomyces malachitofuscus]|nr:anti-sigma factor antagonist [Streptomyces malachitofuscus]
MTDSDQICSVRPRRIPSGPHVVEVVGELDHHTARFLSEAVNDAPFDDHGLVLGLSRLTYCDSTGITALITAYQRAQAAGSPFCLAGVRPDQMRVLRMVGLDEVFTFHPSVDAAVSAFRRG